MKVVRVVAVSRSGSYTFSKSQAARIRLVTGFGVEGDVHAGTTVRHRSRVDRDPRRRTSVRSTSSAPSSRPARKSPLAPV
jgi:hypothetical protein